MLHFGSFIFNMWMLLITEFCNKLLDKVHVDHEGYDKIKNKCKHKNTDSNVKIKKCDD